MTRSSISGSTSRKSITPSNDSYSKVSSIPLCGYSSYTNASWKGAKSQSIIPYLKPTTACPIKERTLRAHNGFMDLEFAVLALDKKIRILFVSV